MRAIQPTETGLLDLAGFQVGYETYGDPARPPVLLLPPWQIVHSRVWKMQVPSLARSFRVVTYDAPGNGRSQRTTDPAAYEYERVARQALGILDHLGIERVSLIGFSRSCAYGLWLAATQPERVERLILIANGVTPDSWGSPPGTDFHEPRETYEGWEKNNAHFWRESFDDWLAFFFSQIVPEAHSTKAVDDCVGWGRETNAEILIASVSRPELWPELPAGEAIAAIHCPVLLIHGDGDLCHSIDASRSLAAVRPDWQLVTLDGSGHAPLVRDPVRVNLLLHGFLNESVPAMERR